MLASASKLISEPRTRSVTRQRISRATFLRTLAACELVANWLTCTVLVFAAQWLQFQLLHSVPTPLHKTLATSVFIACLMTALLNRSRTPHTTIVNPVRETAASIRASLQALVLVIPVFYAFDSLLSRSAIFLAIAILPAALMIQQRLFAAALRLVNQRRQGTENVVIYGASPAALRISAAFQSSPRLALIAIAILDTDAHSVEECHAPIGFRNDAPLPIHCTPITARLLQSLHCDLLLIAATGLSQAQRSSIEAAATEAGARVAHLSQICLDDPPSSERIDLDDLHLTHNTAPSAHLIHTLAKRLLDVFASALLLLLLSPLFLLIALLIRLTSRGPALFVQKRVGLDGQLFRMYKFRSMSRTARRYERSPSSSHDPRITLIGRLLRRTSLDELPQLVNVLLGHMSLVGPRPEMPFIASTYNTRERQRLQVAPGITGLWQLSKDRSYPIHENLHHDLFYIRHRGLSLDIAILLHTLFAMRKGI